MERPEEQPKEDINLTREALGFVPGVGTALDVADVAEDIKEGDYVGAGVGVAATALGAIPVVGRFLGKGVKALAKSFRKLPQADETKDVLSTLNVEETALDGWRATNKTDDAFKQKLVGREVELEAIAKKYKDNPTDEILEEYRFKVEELNPIKKIEEMPELPSDLDVRGALGIKVDNLAGKRTGLVGVNRNIKEGTRVASRLDINGYTEYNKWIATLTVPKAKIKDFVKNNPNLSPTSYARAVHLKNVDLKQSESLQKKSLDIASGRAKGPHAVMEGDFQANDPRDIYEYAREIFEQRPKEWIQVGYNPIRAGFFYDRGTGLPIETAEEIIQVGPLVLAKNVVGGSVKDYFFNKGGAVMEKQMEMAFMNEGGVLKDDGMNKDPVSGNNVPSGSMAEEVRDDIPAQLSEGEYVVPADVVRFHGVQMFEDLRDRAKQGFGKMEQDGRIGGQPVNEDFPFPMDQLQTFDEGGDTSTYEQTFGQPYTPGQRYGSMGGPQGSGFELVTYTSPDGKRNVVIPHYNGKPMSAVPTGFTAQGSQPSDGGGTSGASQGDEDGGDSQAPVQGVPGIVGSYPTPLADPFAEQKARDAEQIAMKPIDSYGKSDFLSYAAESNQGGINNLMRNVPILGSVLGMQDTSIRNNAAQFLRNASESLTEAEFNNLKSFATTKTAAGMLGFGQQQAINPELNNYSYEDYKSKQGLQGLSKGFSVPTSSTMLTVDALQALAESDKKARQEIGGDVPMSKVPKGTLLSNKQVEEYIQDISKNNLIKSKVMDTATKMMLGIRNKGGQAVVSTPQGKDTPVTAEILNNINNNIERHEEIKNNLDKEDSDRMSRGEGPMDVTERFQRHHEQFTGFTSSGEFMGGGGSPSSSSAPQNIGGGGAFPTYDYDRGGAQNRGGLIGKTKPKKRKAKKGLGSKMAT